MAWSISTTVLSTASIGRSNITNFIPTPYFTAMLLRATYHKPEKYKRSLGGFLRPVALRIRPLGAIARSF